MQRSFQLTNKEPNHIYYNIDILNNDTSVHGISKFLDFEETRTGDFIKNPSDYYISIIRFSLMSPSLPVFIPQIKLGQSDPNLTIYKMSISFDNGVDPVINATMPISYQPSDLSEIAPSPPSTQQDVSNRYYHVLNYESWVQNMNHTLDQLVSNAFLPAQYTISPFFRFHGDTNMISLHIPEIWTGKVKLFFNSPLQSLLTIFSYTKYPITGYLNQVDMVYEVQTSILGYDELDTVNTFSYKILKGENSPTSLWNPIQSIVFETSRLPVHKTFSGVPNIYNSDVELNSQGYNNNLTSILTDFSVAFSELNTYKPNIDYIPSGEYRLDDISTSGSLKSIHLNVYWKDKFGNLNKFLLAPNCSASLKIMFRRKDFNGN